MGRRTITLAFGALALVVAVGCGGDSSAEPVATGIAKPAYVKKANAICLKAYSRTRVKYRAFEKAQGDDAFESADSIEEFTDTVILPQRQREVEELRALGAPEGDEERVEAILEAFEEGIDAAEDDPEYAATSTFGVFGHANDLAQKYGLARCRA